jgi:hypothetical protein
MGDFAKSMMSAPSFSWRLKGSATASAFGLTFSGLSLDKVMTMKGFGGFKNVTIDKFDLPSSDPTQGIAVNSISTLFNPSTVSMDTGAISLQVQYKGSSVGSLTASNVTIAPGANSMKLDGFLKTNDMNALSDMFSLFVGGTTSSLTAVAQSITPPGGPVSWLTKAFTGLTLNMNLSPPKDNQKFVNGINVCIFKKYSFGLHNVKFVLIYLAPKYECSIQSTRPHRFIPCC